MNKRVGLQQLQRERERGGKKDDSVRQGPQVYMGKRNGGAELEIEHMTAQHGRYL